MTTRAKFWTALLAAPIALALGAGAGFASGKKPADKDLAATLDVLKSRPLVDLTHTFSGTTPHWPGFVGASVEPWENSWDGDYESGGFYIQWFQIPGQWGTHVDAPLHFHNRSHLLNGIPPRSVDEIPLTQMIMPLVVIDTTASVQANPDYQITMGDVMAWEQRNGKIPEGAFVAMRTDWSKRWPDQAAMVNENPNETLCGRPVQHYPGWSLPVLDFLYNTRKVNATGHETTDTDPGIATTCDDYSLESFVLEQNHYQIELLANLDQVPEAGAIVFVTFGKPENGAGFPARVFAVLPQDKHD